MSTCNTFQVNKWMGPGDSSGIHDTIISGVQKDLTFASVSKPLSSYMIIACSMSTTREPSYCVQNWTKNMLHCLGSLMLPFQFTAAITSLERNKGGGVIGSLQLTFTQKIREGRVLQHIDKINPFKQLKVKGLWPLNQIRKPILFMSFMLDV